MKTLKSVAIALTLISAIPVAAQAGEYLVTTVPYTYPAGEITDAIQLYTITDQGPKAIGQPYVEEYRDQPDNVPFAITMNDSQTFVWVYYINQPFDTSAVINGVLGSTVAGFKITSSGLARQFRLDDLVSPSYIFNTSLTVHLDYVVYTHVAANGKTQAVAINEAGLTIGADASAGNSSTFGTLDVLEKLVMSPDKTRFYTCHWVPNANGTSTAQVRGYVAGKPLEFAPVSAPLPIYSLTFKSSTQPFGLDFCFVST